MSCKLVRAVGSCATVVALGVLATACASSADTQLASPAKDGLLLDSASPQEISGRYTKDGVTVLFSSEHTNAGDHLILLSADGRVLVDVHHAANTKSQTASILNGRLSLAYESDLVKGASPSSSTHGMQPTGDANAANDLVARPETGLLPDLSRELGKAGYDGKAYPSALWLHLMGLNTLKTRDMLVSSPPPGQVHTEGLNLTQCFPVRCPDGHSICFGSPGGCNPGVGDGTVCPEDSGLDLRSNPCSNDCFGMCGPGCTSWPWVCGDCSFHQGCGDHDAVCAACGLTDPLACAICVISAPVAPAGC